MSAARVVLDSFALLAFFRGEVGEEKVAALLERVGTRTRSSRTAARIARALGLG